MMLFSASESVHCVVDAHHLTEKPVEYLGREYELPESDEMESEWNSAEGFLSLDCLEDSLCNILGLEDWDNS